MRKKLKWNFWRRRISPRLIHYSQMISLSLFTFSYFEEFCIWERTRNCVLNCPTRTGRVWWWRSDCCWSWSMSAWWRLPWLLILLLLNPTSLRSDYLIELYWITPRCRVSYFLISDQIIWTLYICISRKCILNGKLHFLVKFSFGEQNEVKFLQ